MSFSNEEWEEISQGVPSLSEPFLQQYLKGRSNLISQEKTTRSDASFRASLSPIARRACAIVDAIREHEKQTVWTSKVEEDMAQANQECIFPGMMFMMAKERMEGTKLWNIVRRMPKGCLLHAHMDAMVDMTRDLLEMPGMHMSSDRALDTPEALEQAEVQFRYRGSECTDGSIWSSGYEKDKFLLLTKTADEFPEGGRDGFLSWLQDRTTLSISDSHKQHHGIDAIWDKFVKCFVVVATIIHYEPMFRRFLRRLMSTLKADGVNWAELR
jgi:adenosine deaminase CECR1